MATSVKFFIPVHKMSVNYHAKNPADWRDI